MSRKLCVYFQQYCDFANENSDCDIGFTNCKNFGEIFDEDDIDQYIEYDLFDEEDEP